MIKQSNHDQTSPHFEIDCESQNVAAWTEVDEGRYMPRRIRGSFLGRALG